MQKELAHILAGKLSELPFVDLMAGLAQTLTSDQFANNELSEAVTKITTKVPVSYDTNAENCQGKEVPLVPDSSKKSIIYFEDFGITTGPGKHGLTGWISRLRLVCWMNRAKFTSDHYTEISGRAINAIVGILADKNPQNVGMFTTLTIKVASVPPQDVAIFNRYTYTEQERQYLRPPFEFFAIDFQSNFLVSNKCLGDISWDNQTCT